MWDGKQNKVIFDNLPEPINWLEYNPEDDLAVAA
jgi:hypothetical protein